MQHPSIDSIVKALMYEGYALYPYRPSLKNCRRWMFGGIYPQEYCIARPDGSKSRMQIECLIESSGNAALNIVIRFLHPLARRVGEVKNDRNPPDRWVESLSVDDQLHVHWQEAIEQEIVLPKLNLDDLIRQPWRQPFDFPGRRDVEPIVNKAGLAVGVVVREQTAITGSVTVTAERKCSKLIQLTVQIVNGSRIPTDGEVPEVELQSLMATHTIATIENGAFVSLMDPPKQWQSYASACKNEGVWPVLVGEEGTGETLLASPIILSDYPRIAPESPTDLFDATEIDELLSLRIQTLTDEEKQVMAGLDERTRAILERTASLNSAEWQSLHGSIRSLHYVGDEFKSIDS